MRIRSMTILASVTALTFLPALLAQSQDKRDFSGTWDYPQNIGSSPAGAGAGEAAAKRRGGIPRQGFSTEEPPMQPWAEAKYKEARQGVTSIYQSGGDAYDPTHSCFPHGMPRIYTTPRPFEIIHAAKEIVMLFESGHWVRRIYTDGRGHPDGYPYTWMGHSDGKWDGNTLVVDTINIKPDSWWLDNLAHPKSDALHIVERIQRPEHEALQIDFTFDDPKAYTKTWYGKKVFALAPPGYEVLEDVTCEEYLDLNKKTGY